MILVSCRRNFDSNQFFSDSNQIRRYLTSTTGRAWSAKIRFTSTRRSNRKSRASASESRRRP